MATPCCAQCPAPAALVSEHLGRAFCGRACYEHYQCTRHQYVPDAARPDHVRVPAASPLLARLRRAPLLLVGGDLERHAAPGAPGYYVLHEPVVRLMAGVHTQLVGVYASRKKRDYTLAEYDAMTETEQAETFTLGERTDFEYERLQMHGTVTAGSPEMSGTVNVVPADSITDTSQLPVWSSAALVRWRGRKRQASDSPPPAKRVQGAADEADEAETQLPAIYSSSSAATSLSAAATGAPPLPATSSAATGVRPPTLTVLPPALPLPAASPAGTGARPPPTLSDLPPEVLERIIKSLDIQSVVAMLSVNRALATALVEARPLLTDLIMRANLSRTLVLQRIDALGALVASGRKAHEQRHASAKGPLTQRETESLPPIMARAAVYDTTRAVVEGLFAAFIVYYASRHATGRGTAVLLLKFFTTHNYLGIMTLYENRHRLWHSHDVKRTLGYAPTAAPLDLEAISMMSSQYIAMFGPLPQILVDGAVRQATAGARVRPPSQFLATLIGNKIRWSGFMGIASSRQQLDGVPRPAISGYVLAIQTLLSVYSNDAFDSDLDFITSNMGTWSFEQCCVRTEANSNAAKFIWYIVTKHLYAERVGMTVVGNMDWEARMLKLYIAADAAWAPLRANAELARPYFMAEAVINDRVRDSTFWLSVLDEILAQRFPYMVRHLFNVVHLALARVTDNVYINVILDYYDKLIKSATAEKPVVTLLEIADAFNTLSVQRVFEAGRPVYATPGALSACLPVPSNTRFIWDNVPAGAPLPVRPIDTPPFQTTSDPAQLSRVRAVVRHPSGLASGSVISLRRYIMTYAEDMSLYWTLIPIGRLPGGREPGVVSAYRLMVTTALPPIRLLMVLENRVLEAGVPRVDEEILNRPRLLYDWIVAQQQPGAGAVDPALVEFVRQVNLAQAAIVAGPPGGVPRPALTDDEKASLRAAGTTQRLYYLPAHRRYSLWELTQDASKDGRGTTRFVYFRIKIVQVTSHTTRRGELYAALPIPDGKKTNTLEGVNLQGILESANQKHMSLVNGWLAALEGIDTTNRLAGSFRVEHGPATYVVISYELVRTTYLTPPYQTFYGVLRAQIAALMAEGALAELYDHPLDD